MNLRARMIAIEMDKRIDAATLAQLRDGLVGLSPQQKQALLKFVKHANNASAGNMLRTGLVESFKADVEAMVDAKIATDTFTVADIDELFP